MFCSWPRKEKSREEKTREDWLNDCKSDIEEIFDVPRNFLTIDFLNNFNLDNVLCMKLLVRMELNAAYYYIDYIFRCCSNRYCTMAKKLTKATLSTPEIKEMYEIVIKAMIDHIFVPTTQFSNNDRIVPAMNPYLSHIIDKIIKYKLNTPYSLFYGVELTSEQFMLLDTKYKPAHYMKKPGYARTLILLEDITMQQFYNSKDIMAQPFNIASAAKIIILNSHEYVYISDNNDDEKMISLEDYITHLMENKEIINFNNEQVQNYVNNFGWKADKFNIDKIQTINIFIGYYTNGKHFNEMCQKFNIKLVKLTNMSENHNGYQFKDGLNIDTKTFAPHGESNPGGIYFIDAANMKSWLTYNGMKMVFIRNVKIPDDAKVYFEKGKFKADKIYLEPRKNIEEIIKIDVNPL